MKKKERYRLETARLLGYTHWCGICEDYVIPVSIWVPVCPVCKSRVEHNTIHDQDLPVEKPK